MWSLILLKDPELGQTYCDGIVYGKSKTEWLISHMSQKTVATRRVPSCWFLATFFQILEIMELRSTFSFLPYTQQLVPTLHLPTHPVAQFWIENKTGITWRNAVNLGSSWKTKLGHQIIGLQSGQRSWQNSSRRQRQATSFLLPRKLHGETWIKILGVEVHLS